MAKHRAEDRHSSSQTSSNPQSGDGGKHSKKLPDRTPADRLLSMRPGPRQAPRGGGAR